MATHHVTTAAAACDQFSRPDQGTWRFRRVRAVVASGFMLLLVALTVVFPAGASATPLNTAEWFGFHEGGLDSHDVDSASFGDTVASGDFNGDGRPDLAVAHPDETVLGKKGVGAVTVVYSTAPPPPSGPGDLDDPSGPAHSEQLAPGMSTGELGAAAQKSLTFEGAEQIHVTAPGIPGAVEDTRSYGRALAAGDLNRDGRDDLAVGSPHDTVDDASFAGSVTVFFGSAHGLLAPDGHPNAIRLDQTTVAGDVTYDDEFGGSLAIGRLDATQGAELIVGVPSNSTKPLYEQNNGSVVIVAFRSKTSTPAITDSVELDRAGRLPGTTYSDLDDVGFDVAAGDVNGDGLDDMFIGAPGVDGRTGRVYFALGSATAGPCSPHVHFGTLDQAMAESALEFDDAFGSELELGDFDGNGRDELAVGSPEEDVGTIDWTGAVNVFYFDSAAKVSAGQLWHQGYPEVGGANEPMDGFGNTLAAGDFDGDGDADLAVTASGENTYKGAVILLVNLDQGRAGVTSRHIERDDPEIPGAGHAYERFGWGLAAGDYFGDARTDLVVGSPGRIVDGIQGAGLVTIL